MLNTKSSHTHTKGLSQTFTDLGLVHSGMLNTTKSKESHARTHRSLILPDLFHGIGLIAFETGLLKPRFGQNREAQMDLCQGDGHSF